MPTHDVTNQAPALVDYNLFSRDRALNEAVEREGASWVIPTARKLGETLGSGDVIEWGFEANNNPPVLHTHDARGRRVDQVHYHPSYHALMRLAVEYGLHNSPWREPREGAHVARAALFFLVGQNEPGHSCPISMTYAAVPTLRREPDVLSRWQPLLAGTQYDQRFVPAEQKSSVLIGMAMTEKQGGSDVRANTTRAVACDVGGGGANYRITGHKWFCSAPMSDAFLVLAQAPGGLSCFLLPRWTPDGKLNNFYLQRLKNKLGNRSNASSEVEFDGALARLIGEEGRGVRTIVEMVNHTRLDCTLGSAALMRQALAQAIHHTRHRSAFGHLLIDQPAMQNVLADLCVEAEAATLLAMRLARAYDRAEESEARFRRIATAVAKYWVCKRAAVFAGEALECLGGNGFVEDSMMPRLFRESPLNSIWEGSGNVICLDVRRAIETEPGTLEVLVEEIERGCGSQPRFDQFVARLKGQLPALLKDAWQSRTLVERLALALEGSLVVRFSPAALADAFCASRLTPEGGRAFGTLPAGLEMRAIIDRAWPA
ncbi:MAG TPA: isovaleryl-CoA dehydrogenase [Pirellulales bacterium]|jgi:putative acyl-CoA dehydrogenase|nr:isovaleryl-CoA dehydrogenase [Pirellulales bacterium]